MIVKSKKSIGIFDINDETKEDEYHSFRMKYMDKEEYKRKYQNLKHLFYKKEWFLNLSKRFKCKAEIWDQNFVAYSNSKLRFNVVFKKL